MFLLRRTLQLVTPRIGSRFLVIIALLFASGSVWAQKNDGKTKTDSKSVSQKDTAKNKPQVIEFPIDYTAEDSIRISNSEKKLYLYGKGVIVYGKNQLKADYIEFSFETNVAHATGLPDSTGTIVGKPEFKEGNEPFNADDITYNFKTKKAVIKGVITKQNDGYLHSEVTKKQDNGEIHIKNAKYTTCDDPHPHFYFALSKAIVVPNERIISGPMYLVLEDVPINKFLPLPFGYIPTSKHRSSGFLMPKYGEENRRGFFLREMGWYFVLNDNMDLAVTGEIYSKGTWGLNAMSKYAKKYKYSGNFDFQYKNNVTSEKGLSDYAVSNTISLKWSHTQDSKANPTQNFSASVNFETNQYHKYNATNYNDYLTSNRSSSISFTKKFPNSPFNLSTQASASQNVQTRKMSLNLPSATLSMSPVYLFKSKNSVGTPKWYEQIGLAYNANLDNRATTSDSTIFTQKTLKDFITKFTHGTSLSVPFKLGGLVTVTPSVAYQGMVNTKYINKTFVEREVIEYDSVTSEGTIHKTKVVTDQLRVDTIQGFKYAHQMSPSLSISVNPELFVTGVFTAKAIKKYVDAVRYHVAAPVSFSFTPGLGFPTDQYYKTVRVYSGTGTNRKYTDQRYSIFENVGTAPQDVSKKSGSVSLGLENEFEAKVRDRSDTTGATYKKIKLLNLRMSGSLNPFADSMRLSPNISVTGTIELTKTLRFNFSSGLDPYDYDANGRDYNKFLYESKKFPFRMTNFSTSFSWSLNKAAKYKSTIVNGIYHPIYNPYSGIIYDDFNVPWNVQVNYSFNYSKTTFNSTTKEFEGNLQQNLSVSGSLSLTKNWKIGSNTSYDVKMKKFSGTTVNVSRDLHCWEMSFVWIPYGYIKSYNFKINIKSSAFKSVEYKIDRRN